MTIRPILILPDPRLREISTSVDDVDDAARRLADDMLETMYDAPGVGLAAIQIGVPKRVVVLDCADKEAEPDPIRLFNPEIVWSSEETNVHEEGCLSIPEFFEDVTRPQRVGVRYRDETGQIREVEWDGLLATCIQHEIDHLNGVLFIDHISRLKRDRVVRKFQKAAREREQGAA